MSIHTPRPLASPGHSPVLPCPSRRGPRFVRWNRTVALGICGLITMSADLPSSFATVPLYFPGQINVQVRQSTKALVHLDLGNGGLVEVIAGRDDGFLSLIESFGHGNFRSTVVFALAGEVVELAVHTPGPGPDRILVALTVNPDVLHILSIEGEDPLFLLLASINLDEDPGGLAGGPIAAGGEFGLAVTLPGVDRWVLVDETTGEWSISQDVHGGDRPVAVTLMDVNEDQVPEVVTADSGVLTGALSIFQKDGEGLFQLTNQTVAPATLVYVTPFTAGSTQKLYVSYADSAFISVFEPQAGSLVESERIVTASPIDGLVVAELGANRNGLWGWNRDSGVVQFFEEQFDVWQPIESYYCGGRAVDVDLHDLNNDSLPDLMVANGEAETVALLFANDSPSFRAYLAALVPSSPNDGFVMDEDLDGHLDYLVTSVGSSTVEFMRGDGRGHLMRDSQPLILDSPARTLTPLFADGDNLVDLAIVQSITNRVTIMLRQPAGDYLEANSVSTGLGPFRLYASDLDGDGFVDLLVRNAAPDNIIV